MILKDYQTRALNQFELFLQKCREHKSPIVAFEETTREWIGTALSYQALKIFPHVPYVCLRIPTGGGKTLIGGLSIERVNRSLLYSGHSVTLWLVPSNPILEQTLKALKEPSHFLHQTVCSSLGETTVLTIEEALRVKPAVLNNSNTIIVSTMQSFKQENKDLLNVYKQNSEMMPHFENIYDQKEKGNHSLVDVLRMRHPFIIVDEAHNQGTDLAFETLSRFEPCAILELTATPDRIHHPSNVLFSVSASELQACNMIKMPIEVVRRENPQEALRDAISCLNKLEGIAQKELPVSGEYLRPIMLLQAERHNQDHETLTPDKIKKMLIDDFEIPENQIIIAIGNMDELSGLDVLYDSCPVRFIITIDKLREGWDCPFAYILCSFRNTSSANAAEQILGRILRLPYTTKKSHPELNEAYAFITSANFQETVSSIRDGLIKNGFDRQEVKDFVRATEPSDLGELFNQSITFSSPEMPDLTALSNSMCEKIEITPEKSSVTLKTTLSKVQAKELENAFKTKEGKDALKNALIKQAEPAQTKPLFPSEKGEIFKVPALSIQQGNLWEAFEETHLLQGDWKLTDYSAELSEDEFQKPSRTAQGGRFIVREDDIKFEYFDNIENQLALFDFQTEWNQIQLVSWLERNIPDESLLPDDKAAFLNRGITSLIQNRSFSIEELNYSKFRLRNALERKIKFAKQEAIKGIYQKLILIPDQFRTQEDASFIFESGRYAFDYNYGGFTELPKHFFPNIGNLKDSGEEFDCALFLSTQLTGLKYWIRNVERKGTSFSLQTSTDRFYPDFICLMEDGRVLVVEYKNELLWDTSDSEEKRIIGQLWAKRSNGKCVFVMPKGKNWNQILEALK